VSKSVYARARRGQIDAMTIVPPSPDRFDQALRDLPRAFPGPGGAVAILREGEVLVRHAWGFANAERRIVFTPRTLFRMCSITKQFTSALVLDAFPDVSVLDADVGARLPNLAQAAPSALHLCHNQSGLRDYWAVAMLHGAPAESAFGEIEAARTISAAKTLQFSPGTRYSYCNQNFRLLSDILEARTGAAFADQLRTRIFEVVGMEQAFLAADTRAMPDGTEGYEGTPASGFRPAENRILWTGDAGLGASLDDMIAWERHIDAKRDEPDSLSGRIAAPVSFKDGTPAAYGFGLHRRPEWGRAASGHGGALRGWRSHRLYVRRERLSVVVMLNHLSDAYAAAVSLLAAALGEPTPTPSLQPDPDWLGAYIDPETGLSVRIDRASPSQLRLRFGHSAERLELQPGGSATSGGMRLRRAPDGVWMDRPQDNQSVRLTPMATVDQPLKQDAAGLYRCDELEAYLAVVDAGGALYGGFSGFLGQGRMEQLDPIGPDVWALPCARALDHTPPGDWTLAFQRNASGRIESVTVGCWLARGLNYRRVGRG
jgi:D-aminopeptidase